MAMDHVVNLMIEDLDAGRGFIEWIVEPPPLMDAKYRGMSFLEVLQDLLKNPPPSQPKPQGGKGSGQPGGTLDQHIPGKKQGMPGADKMSAEEVDKLKQDM